MAKAMSQMSDKELTDERDARLTCADDTDIPFERRLSHRILANQYDAELTRRAGGEQ